MHRHIEDIRKDLNYSNIDVNVFSETWLCYLDSDTDYSITGYTLFRNDSQLDVFNTRPYGGTAVYSKIPFLLGFKVFIGDFNNSWLNEKDKIPLYNLFIRDHSYRQLVSCSTTDNRTTIDHVYTNLPESQIHVHILETYFSDHKAICALIRK